MSLVDLHTKRSACPPSRHSAAVSAAVFSPDGKTLVTASEDKR